MDRNCDICVYRINGACSKWECEFQTLEEHDKQIIADEQDRIANELKKLQTVDVEYCPGGYDDYICKDDVLIIVKGKRWRE